MAREPLRSANADLRPLPGDDEVLRAVLDLEASASLYRDLGVSANHVAQRLRVEPSRRAGRGAVKGSWSGRMSPALRIAPRLRSLVTAGLLMTWYDERSRHVYSVTAAGRERLEQLEEVE